MTAPRRWIRLDVGWEDSWLDALTGAAAGCWPRLLCWVKRDGVQGRCKRPRTEKLARVWRVAIEDVQELEEAAIRDGALVMAGGDWVIPNWLEYNPNDTSSAERMRKLRASRDGSDAVTPVTERNEPSPTVTSAMCTSRDSDVDVDVTPQQPPPPAKPDPVSVLWEVYLQELGGKPTHQPAMTAKRRAAIRALYDEKLRKADDPPEAFRRILRTVKGSSHHMGKREYQFPESLFGSPEKRDRWWLLSQDSARASPPEHGGFVSLNGFKPKGYEGDYPPVEDVPVRRIQFPR